MGRTNPTYRDALRAVQERWEDYKRGLRHGDQPHFEQLFKYARDHADASGLLNHSNPIVPALFSIDIEQQARLEDLERRVEDLEAKVESPDSDGNTED